MAAGRHVLVTGGAGFIGSHLVERLLGTGTRVTCVDSFDDFYDPLIKRRNIAAALRAPTTVFQLIEADIRDIDCIERAIDGVAVDAIVHLAARAGVRPSIDDPVLYAQSNIEGTVSLLEFARRAGIREFVFGSSSSVYGNNAKVPFSEADAVDCPISPYAAAKRGAELFCSAFAHLYGMSILSLRFFTVYGPRQRPDLAIHKFAKLIVAGEQVPVYGDGTMRRDFTYVDDTVSGIVAGLEWVARNRGFEIVNLGAGGSVAVMDMVKGLAAALHRHVEIQRLPRQPGDVERTFADTEKAWRILGYKPYVPFFVGINRFAEWFAEEMVVRVASQDETLRGPCSRTGSAQR